MRMPTAARTLRRTVVLCGLSLVALALEVGEPSACRLERSAASGTSSSVTSAVTRPRLHVPGKADDRRSLRRVEKQPADATIAPRSGSADQRRGGIGTLIGITLT